AFHNYVIAAHKTKDAESQKFYLTELLMLSNESKISWETSLKNEFKFLAGSIAYHLNHSQKENCKLFLNQVNFSLLPKENDRYVLATNDFCMLYNLYMPNTI